MQDLSLTNTKLCDIINIGNYINKITTDTKKELNNNGIDVVVYKEVLDDIEILILLMVR